MMFNRGVGFVRKGKEVLLSGGRPLLICALVGLHIRSFSPYLQLILVQPDFSPAGLLAAPIKPELQKAQWEAADGSLFRLFAMCLDRRPCLGIGIWPGVVPPGSCSCGTPERFNVFRPGGALHCAFGAQVRIIFSLCSLRLVMTMSPPTVASWTWALNTDTSLCDAPDVL